jgi:DNA-binding winged helix-turn-helix (wHTH) protein
MTATPFRFAEFVLDAQNRRLTRDGTPVELNARYFDALMLLAMENGRLVTKDRFMAEVWRGVPVTDEALTQCIRSLRRVLGDDAAAPRFIETVPKHGYRFITLTAPGSDRTSAAQTLAIPPWSSVAILSIAGTLGGGAAGVAGGLFYGFGSAGQPGSGAASALIVILCLTTLTALVGAAGVAFGIAAADLVPGRPGRWSIVGGALGGMIVGAVVKLIGLDAFDLLFGRAPTEMTGAAEGALLGGAVGIGAWLGARGRTEPPLRRSIAAAALAGGAAGVIIPLLGGRLMGGSLALLAQSFPASRLRLDPISALFGEAAFGPVTRTVTGGLEGAVFAACIVGAMIVARRRMDARGA